MVLDAVVLVFAWFIIACQCMFYILASKFLHSQFMVLLIYVQKRGAKCGDQRTDAPVAATNKKLLLSQAILPAMAVPINFGPFWHSD
jgi:hypothetical protein